MNLTKNEKKWSDAEVRKNVLIRLLQIIAVTVLQVSLLFVSAGHINWMAA
jgi:hypothetical protein